MPRSIRAVLGLHIIGDFAKPGRDLPALVDVGEQGAHVHCKEQQRGDVVVVVVVISSFTTNPSSTLCLPTFLPLACRRALLGDVDLGRRTGRGRRRRTWDCGCRCRLFVLCHRLSPRLPARPRLVIILDVRLQRCHQRLVRLDPLGVLGVLFTKLFQNFHRVKVGALQGLLERRRRRRSKSSRTRMTDEPSRANQHTSSYASIPPSLSSRLAPTCMCCDGTDIPHAGPV